ncbi:AAA family ATPase [Mesorhizobium xinjiangense]|uniref:AAA family ATPase n=1 Tax=Mesorhizobium xinjiangense TaxID=2678685 RepID=UPI0012EE0CA7|nr:AAA family ATPase [Mesorhizobium xinjiangense]
MNPETNRFFVVTGGPGSGKSTLLDAMASRGLRLMEEAGRSIIQSQQAIGGTALPWDDRALFAELMLGWEMRSHEMAARQAGVTMFDRGIVDVIGYLTLCGLPVADHISRAAKLYRYNRTVFIAPPWREIYVNDHERKQDFAEAGRTYDAMRHAYENYGYSLREIPRLAVEARVSWILAEMQEAGQGPAS